MEDAGLRNFRDFLLIYNKMTESCFSKCIDSLNNRKMSSNEETCVDRCAAKHVNINHRMMSIYMEVQPLIVSRRVEEMNKQNQLAAAGETVKSTTEKHYLGVYASWEEWWTYDGISGPSFWGLINPEWSLCNKGRRQSPINIDPNKLLFDPHLRFVHIDKHRVSGNISNTGHSVIFVVDNSTRQHVNVTGGPLSYKYQFEEIHLHYGIRDEVGSEHTVNGYSFPAEVQLFGFNSHLYHNMTEAMHRSQGVVAVSLLTQLGDLSNPELRILTDQLDKIKYKGQQAPVKNISIRQLLPDTDFFMTYEGSATMPGCDETVTWIILNKPIYITKQQLHALRKLMQGDKEHPKAPLGSNFRSPLPLHHRPVRTNIDFKGKQGKHCPTMYHEMYYKANMFPQP